MFGCCSFRYGRKCSVCDCWLSKRNVSSIYLCRILVWNHLDNYLPLHSWHLKTICTTWPRLTMKWSSRWIISTTMVILATHFSRHRSFLDKLHLGQLKIYTIFEHSSEGRVILFLNRVDIMVDKDNVEVDLWEWMLISRNYLRMVKLTSPRYGNFMNLVSSGAVKIFVGGHRIIIQERSESPVQNFVRETIFLEIIT